MAQYIKDNGEWKKIGGVEKYPADFGTRAEFEAKKDDLPVGTVFTTTDEFEEGEKDIYSTEEVKTNKVWIDGKPVYRKTVITQTPSSAGSWQNKDTISPDIDTCIKVEGTFYSSSSENQWVPLPYSEVNYQVNVSITNGTIRMYAQSSVYCNKKAVITVEYTKTN